MTRADEIRTRIEQALAPASVRVEDQSHLHAGHAGSRPEGETHFRAVVVAERFAGRGRVERQRLVYAAVGDLMAGPIHALALRTLTPEEAEREGTGDARR